MAWKTIDARSSVEPKPKGRVARHASPAAMRLCGLLGFLGSAYVTVVSSAYLLGRPTDFLDSGNWSAAELTVLSVALVAALLGGLMGAGIGLSLDIRNAHVNRLLLIVWHFLACGQLLAFGGLTLALRPTRRVASIPETIEAFGVTALATTAAGLVLFALGQFKEDRQPNLVLCACITVPMGVFLGREYARIFSIDGHRATVVGVAFGVAVFVVSAYMIRRDYDQMAEARRLFGGDA
jgi:hypothetical protein